MTRADHTKGTEDLLREVMGGPAYDVTPDGDPLAPVWRKARAIRRRRTLAAGGTAAVVIAAAVATGIAVTGQQAKGGPAVISTPPASTPVSTTPINPTPSGGPSSSPSAPAVQTSFKHTAIVLENAVGGGAYVVGTETSEGGESFRIVLLDTGTGRIYRSQYVPGHAGGIATDGALRAFVTVKGTPTIEIATIHAPSLPADGSLRLDTYTDPRGPVSGPIAMHGDGLWVADLLGIAALPSAGGNPTPVSPGRVCQLLTNTFSGDLLYVVGGPKGGACIQATAFPPASATGVDVADTTDASLGLQGLVTDPTGFWIEQPTGTMGYYEHVTYNPATGAPVVSAGHVSGSNGQVLTVAGGHAWVSDPGSLKCVDTDGNVLWQRSLPTDDGAAHVFATPTGAVLVTNTYAEPFDTSVCA